MAEMTQGTGMTPTEDPSFGIRSSAASPTPDGPLADSGSPQQAGLSQWERVADAYVAPSKTFADIRRSATWWLPFVLGIVVFAGLAASIDRKIGFNQIAETTIAQNGEIRQKIDTLPAASQTQAIHAISVSTRLSTYGHSLIDLIFALIAAGILMGSFQLGLAAKAPYKQYVAVWFYAGLPFLLKYILAAIVVFTGGAAGFDIHNPLGSNIAWYLGSDAPRWLRTMLTHIDIFTIWMVVLLVLGCSIITGVKRRQAATVVVGWWILMIAASTISAALHP